MTERPSPRVSLGRVAGVFGVRGWVRVYSYTEPRLNIVNYSPWRLSLSGASQTRRVVSGQNHGDGVIVQLEGISDRDAAAGLVGAEIEVERAELAPPGDDQFYWADLQGMEVRTTGGELLGVVDHLLATGANDVMVVTGGQRHMVPFLYGSVVRAVDTEGRIITVEWDEDF